MMLPVCVCLHLYGGLESLHKQKNLSICMKLAPPIRVPLISSKHPWERIATDLFELNKQTYLLLVDFYSRYPEVIKLN